MRTRVPLLRTVATLQWRANRSLRRDGYVPYEVAMAAFVFDVIVCWGVRAGMGSRIDRPRLVLLEEDPMRPSFGYRSVAKRLRSDMSQVCEQANGCLRTRPRRFNEGSRSRNPLRAAKCLLTKKPEVRSSAHGVGLTQLSLVNSCEGPGASQPHPKKVA